MRSKTVAQISREKRLRIRMIRQKIKNGQCPENVHLVFRYREQKRIGTLKYREKKKFLLSQYHSLPKETKDYFKNDYENALKQRDRENERRRIRRSNASGNHETRWLDSFDLNDLILFE